MSIQCNNIDWKEKDKEYLIIDTWILLIFVAFDFAFVFCSFGKGHEVNELGSVRIAELLSIQPYTCD